MSSWWACRSLHFFLALNLNGFNFNQSVVESNGRVVNTWAVGSYVLGIIVYFGLYIHNTGCILHSSLTPWAYASNGH